MSSSSMVENSAGNRFDVLRAFGYKIPPRYSPGEVADEFYFPLSVGKYTLGPESTSFLLSLVTNGLENPNLIPHALDRHSGARSILERIQSRLESGNCVVRVEFGKRFGNEYNGYLVVDFEEIERDVYVPLYVLLGEAIRGMELSEGRMKNYLSAVSEIFGPNFAAFVAVVGNPDKTDDFQLTRLINNGKLDQNLVKYVNAIRNSILVKGRNGMFVSLDSKVHDATVKKYEIKSKYFPVLSKMRDRLVLPTVLRHLMGRARDRNWDKQSINWLMRTFSGEGNSVTNGIVTVYDVHQGDRARQLARILPKNLRGFKRYLSALKMMMDSDYSGQNSSEFQELISDVSTWIEFYESFGISMGSLDDRNYLALLEKLRAGRDDKTILDELFRNSGTDEGMRRGLFYTMIGGIKELDERVKNSLWEHMKKYPGDRYLDPEALQVLITELPEP